MHKLQRPILEPVVQLIHKGQEFSFLVDLMPPLRFWGVESEGRVYRTPIRVKGDEQSHWLPSPRSNPVSKELASRYVRSENGCEFLQAVCIASQRKIAAYLALGRFVSRTRNSQQPGA